MEQATPPKTPFRKKTELFSGDLQVGQKAPVDLAHAGEYQAGAIEPVQGFNTKKYLDDLAFMEEPVTIRLERSSEKNAPKTVPAAVNGKGCEVFLNGKWLEMTYIPMGQPVTIKRKYVEVLARAKPDSVTTNVIERDNEDPQNVVDRVTTSKHPFSVIHDASPRGADWLTKIMLEG